MKRIAIGLAMLCAGWFAMPLWAADVARPLKLGLWPYHSAHYLLSYYEGLRTQLESKLR